MNIYNEYKLMFTHSMQSTGLLSIYFETSLTKTDLQKLSLERAIIVKDQTSNLYTRWLKVLNSRVSIVKPKC